MLEKTDKAVAELLEELPEIIKGASGQLPDVANQLLIYGAFDTQLGLGCAIVIMLVAILCGSKSFFADTDFGRFIGLILFMISLVLLGRGISQLYKISYAPKVYLLDKAGNYIRNK